MDDFHKLGKNKVKSFVFNRCVESYILWSLNGGPFKMIALNTAIKV